jgi:hypothetical protein
MQFMDGGVDEAADKKRHYLETLFEKALDLSTGGEES